MAVRYSTNWCGPINYEWIQEHGSDWAAGRIDVHGNVPEYTELALPAMKSRDWFLFTEWLGSFSTRKLWSLNELVAEYEKTHPKITWFSHGL